MIGIGGGCSGGGGVMGVLRSTQSMQAEVEEMRAALLHGHGGGAAAAGWRPSAGDADVKRTAGGDGGAAGPRTVCVTGGISFVGFAVVDRLLRHGYTVRLALETQGQLQIQLTPTSFTVYLFDYLLCLVWLFRFCVTDMWAPVATCISKPRPLVPIHSTYFYYFIYLGKKNKHEKTKTLVPSMTYPFASSLYPISGLYLAAVDFTSTSLLSRSVFQSILITTRFWTKGKRLPSINQA